MEEKEGGPPDLVCWRLRIYWNGEENGDWYCDSEPLAMAQLFEYVKAWWRWEFFTRPYDPGAGQPPVLVRPLPGDPQEAIRVYFEEISSETWSIEPIVVRNRAIPVDTAACERMADKHLQIGRIEYDGKQVFPPVEEELP